MEKCLLFLAANRLKNQQNNKEWLSHNLKCGLKSQILGRCGQNVPKLALLLSISPRNGIRFTN